MEVKYLLKDNYINVGGSYGGSQTFFRNDLGLLNKSREKGGCGIVALTDIILYLSKVKTVNTQSEYKKLFKTTAKMIGWFPVKFGMNFVHQVMGLRILLLYNRLNFKCRWCFSKRKMFKRIKEMINNDIPVIMCIPKVLGFNKEHDNLAFYDEKLTAVSGANGHFVVVTGIYTHPFNNEIYLSISSWGKKYYINLNEYLFFSKRHLMGIAGNIMKITKGKN